MSPAGRLVRSLEASNGLQFTGADRDAMMSRLSEHSKAAVRDRCNCESGDRPIRLPLLEEPQASFAGCCTAAATQLPNGLHSPTGAVSNSMRDALRP